MVLSVRERLDALRPVRSASTCRESGCVAAIRLSSARFLFDSTLAKLSGEVNQTLGSPLAGLRRPRAIAMVRFFMSSRLAMPTFSVFLRLIGYDYQIMINVATTVPRMRRSTSHKRVYASLRRAMAKWCDADPGPFQTRNLVRSRF